MSTNTVDSNINSNNSIKEGKRRTASKTTMAIREIVITALFIALVFVFTAFINVKLPIGGNGGLIHLGNIPLFIAAIVFGKRTGCIAGAVGMGMFDLLSGWLIWAPFTFVIVGLMGFVAGLITEKKKSHRFVWYTLAIIAALAIKIVGYYFAEVILYHNFIVPFASIPGNVIQVVFAGIVTLIIAYPLCKIANRMGLREN